MRRDLAVPGPAVRPNCRARRQLRPLNRWLFGQLSGDEQGGQEPCTAIISDTLSQTAQLYPAFSGQLKKAGGGDQAPRAVRR